MKFLFVIRTLFRKSLDGLLFGIMIFVFSLFLSLSIENNGMKKFLFVIELKYILITSISFFLLIGIIRLISKKRGNTYIYKENISLGKRFLHFIIGLLLSAIIVLLATLIMKSLNNLKIAPLLITLTQFFVMIIAGTFMHIAFLGKQCPSGVFYSFIIKKVFQLGSIIVNGIHIASEFVGVRIVTAIIELLLCFISTKVLTLLFKNAVYPEKVTLSYLIDEYLEKLFWGKISFNFNNSMLSGGAESQVSSSTYLFFKMLPAGCILTGIICMLLGIGIIGVFSKKMMGHQWSLVEAWDKKHSKIRIYDHKNHTYYETNGNPHTLLSFLLFHLFLIINGLLGWFLPVFILGNLFIGVLLLIFRFVVSLIEKNGNLDDIEE